MTSKQSNLDNLIQDYAALSAENAKLKAAIADALHSLRNGRIPSALSVLEMTTWLPPAEAPEAIAPKPKFQVGDRVRIIGNQETPPPTSDYAVGEYDTIATIEEKDGYKLRYHGGRVGSLVWYGRELIPYNDTETPKPDLSFTAHGDATSDGCQMCGNEYKSLNAEGYCSSCWTIWKS